MKVNTSFLSKEPPDSCKNDIRTLLLNVVFLRGVEAEPLESEKGQNSSERSQNSGVNDCCSGIDSTSSSILLLFQLKRLPPNC